MRSAPLNLTRVAFAAAIVAPVPALADFCYFKDDNVTRITVVSNGFFGAPLTLDGRIVVKHSYRNVYTKMPKSKRITFTGTDNDFATPYDFSADYIFVSKKDLHVPLAELIVSGVGGDRSEAFSGTFRGFGDPKLPTKILKGAIVMVTGRHSIGIQFGQTGLSTTIGVQVQYTR